MRAEKESIVSELCQQLGGASYVLLADFTGLTADRSSDLRLQLHSTGARLQVVSNRLLKIAAKKETAVGLEGVGLTGPTALITGAGDIVAAAKLLRDFARAHERPLLKGGALQGAPLTADEVQQLADLPPREVMLATAVGTIAAPMTQLVRVLSQKAATIVYVLDAVRQKKEGAAA